MRLNPAEAKRIAAARIARRHAAQKTRRRMSDGAAYTVVRMSRRRLKAFLMAKRQEG